jgi:Na+/melibiose symporter-like transporter
LKYVKGQQVLWATLTLAVIINLTGWPFHTSLMPIFARDVLGTGSAGLGMLVAAFGIGAVVGSIAWPQCGTSGTRASFSSRRW